MYSPVEVLANLQKNNPAAATFIYGGVAVFAAAAVVLSFNIDLRTAIFVGVAILVFALLVVALSRAPGLVTDVLAWGFVIILIAIMIIFVYVAAVRDPSPFRPIECLVRFWEKCETVQDEVADRNEPTVTIQTITPPPQTPSVNRAEYTVLIQFAGFRREDVADAAKALAKVGWKVPQPNRGGERTGKADGLSEVRYHAAAQAAAAELLAVEIEKTGIRKDVQAVQAAAVDAKTLEVWIGR